jgi:hypothetical protein
MNKWGQTPFVETPVAGIKGQLKGAASIYLEKQSEADPFDRYLMNGVRRDALSGNFC